MNTDRSAPDGMDLSAISFDTDIMNVIVRMTGGNFRLLNRLLTQIDRIMQVNEATVISLPIVEAARESLVVGQS